MKHTEDITPQRTDGFALVVTLSLMVLLALVAVGLLSLSAVTLRTAGAGGAQATAQANARLAVILAIGELQKELGPDQRISAPAPLLGATSMPSGPLGPNGALTLGGSAHDLLPWKTLHHWQQMHRRQLADQDALSARALHSATPTPDPVSNPAWNSGNTRLSPVLVRMQSLISFGVKRSGRTENHNLYFRPSLQHHLRTGYLLLHGRAKRPGLPPLRRGA